MQPNSHNDLTGRGGVLESWSGLGGLLGGGGIEWRLTKLPCSKRSTLLDFFETCS